MGTDSSPINSSDKSMPPLPCNAELTCPLWRRQYSAVLAEPRMCLVEEGGTFLTSCSAQAARPSSCPHARPLVQFPTMANLTSFLSQLKRERTRLASQLEYLTNALSALTSVSNNRRVRTISAAGRARIGAAQRARWAKAKGQKVVSIATRKRRKLSAAALANVRAAQKARWAKWRKVQKKA